MYSAEMYLPTVYVIGLFRFCHLRTLEWSSLFHSSILRKWMKIYFPFHLPFEKQLSIAALHCRVLFPYRASFLSFFGILTISRVFQARKQAALIIIVSRYRPKKSHENVSRGIVRFFTPLFFHIISTLEVHWPSKCIRYGISFILGVYAKSRWIMMSEYRDALFEVRVLRESLWKNRL